MVGHFKKDYPQTPAGVFAIIQAVVAANPFGVTDQLLVNDSYFTVLFDSGVTHYIWRQELITSMPVRIENRELSVDLVQLELIVVDIILGMDFISNYSTRIDCKQKMVTFQAEGEDPFIYVGYVQGFLAVVIDPNRPETFGLKDVKVVREFLDVFFEELRGLPPRQEINFIIDLAPGVEPVSKAPYKMALA
ncbi:hypothetical protein CsatB_007591 [Cannabis sativa]|uniref:uncharacterized protein LOC133032298 n=1 Tax=Cannabis sativa TaxID=3483 RepID=UPI0029C9E7E7|nr:uncharacterized protein LOC133032298 [Cannabis sativa]